MTIIMVTLMGCNLGVFRKGDATLVGYGNLRGEAGGFAEGASHDVHHVSEDRTVTLKRWDELDSTPRDGSLVDDHLEFSSTATLDPGSIQYSCDFDGAADLVGDDEAEAHFSARCSGDAGDSEKYCTYAGRSSRCSGFDSEDCN